MSNDTARESRLDALMAANRIVDEFEAAWKNGENPLPEDYLAEGGEDVIVELIAIEIDYRSQRGDSPSPAEFVQRFPQIDSDVLEELFVAPRVSPNDLTLFGRFKLIEKVGMGTCGVVWKAFDTKLDRIVAIKTPHPGILDLPGAVERFRREGRSTARLRHRHIAEIFDTAMTDGVPILVQEFVDGHSLREALKSGPLPFVQAAAYAADVAEALHYAHQLGTVHRDIKPANLMLVQEPNESRLRIVIVDFGLAWEQDSVATLTAAGELLGTPAYMAPEQALCEPGKIGPATDIYSIGSVLYEMLSGRLPYPGSRTEVMKALISDTVPPTLRSLDPQIPRDLEAICLKALSKRAIDRYQRANDLADDLRRWLRSEPVRARSLGPFSRLFRWARRRPMAAAMVAAAMLMTTALLGLIIQYTINLRLQDAFQSAVAARDALDVARKRAEESLYSHQMALASRAWASGNPSMTEQFLDSCPLRLRGWEWSYLARCVKRSSSNHLLAAKSDGSGPFLGLDCVAYRPDGARIAVCGSYGGIIVWDTESRAEVWRSETASGYGCLAWDTSGHSLASGSVRGEVTIWDADHGTVKNQLPAAEESIYSVTFDSTGNRLAVGYGLNQDWITVGQETQGCARVWELAPIQLIRETSGHTLPVAVVEFVDDGKQLLTAEGVPGFQRCGVGVTDAPSRLTLFDIDSGVRVHEFESHRGPLAALSVSPDGKQVAGAGSSPLVTIWNLSDAATIAVLSGHSRGVRGLAFRHDNGRIATAGVDGLVRVWDRSNDSLVETYRGHTRSVTGVSYRQDGQELASCGHDLCVRLWDQRSNLEYRVLNHPGPVAALAFANDGRLVTACNAESHGQRNHELILWDLSSGKKIDQAEVDTYQLQSVCVTPNSQFMIAVGKGSWISVWPLRQSGFGVQNLDWMHDLDSSESGSFTNVAASPGGGLIAMTGDRKFVDGQSVDELTLCDSQGHELTRLSAGVPNILHDIGFSPSGTIAVVAGHEGHLIFWDTVQHRLIWQSKEYRAAVEGVVFSSDGRHLAIACRDDTAAIWDVSSLTSDAPKPHLAHRLIGHGCAVLCVAYHPDGSRIVTGADDGAIKFWDSETGHEVLTLTGHSGAITRVAFSPDGTTLASASADGTVRLWDNSR